MREYYETEILPLALQYGMTVEQFWHDDPDLIVAYHEAYYSRLHTEAHAYGYYNYVALGTALGNAFRKKGTKAEEYPKKPLFEKMRKKKAASVKAMREKAKQQISWLNSVSYN